MGWCPREGASVTDRSGVTYRLGAEIDRGGQGIVFRTEADGAAVKISFRDSDAIENQIRAVARLPISDLPVALPRHTLKPPAVGYTMTHLTGMVGASSLANSPRREQFHEWYCRTGGVRKRLAVAAQLADIVSSLHARGLVYGDISANNTMVSEAADRHRVFLIDLDNLASTLDPPKRIFTSAFAAPEQPSIGTSQLTDAFSLATVVYALVAATNPFYGRRLDDLPPEDFEGEPWALQCPWIEDPDDPSNRWSFGAPDQVPPRLRSLLGRAFTVGRSEPLARPPAAVIAQASWSGWLASSRCVCGSSQLPSASSCPACDRPAVWTGFRVYEEADASATTYRRSPFIGLVAGEERTVPARALGCAVSDANTPGVSISRTDSTMVLESLHEDIDVSPDGSTSGAVLQLPWPSTVRMRRAHRAPLVLAAVGEQ